MLYEVNADILLNVTTVVDIADLTRRSQGAVRQQAEDQILAKNFEIGDPVSGPTINWV